MPPNELTPTKRDAVHAAAASLDGVRSQRTAAAERLQAARADVLRLEREAEELTGRRATPRQVDAATRRLTTSRLALDTAAMQVLEIDREIDRIREGLDGLVKGSTDPATALDGKIPVALLPVRIETRYVADDLLVRFYPDVLHIDQLERLLTADEEAWGHAYWRERSGLESASEIADLWERSIQGLPPGRAAWVAEQTTPANVERIATEEPQFPQLTLRPAGPSRAPIAQLLPARWVVLGYRKGVEVLRRWSGFVADPLPVGLDPGHPSPDAPAERPDVQGALAIDAAARWIVDFDAAVAAGMAVRIRPADVKGGLGAEIDELLVLGVDHRRTPTEAATHLDAALEAQRFTAGADFLELGTPTNQDDDTPPLVAPSVAPELTPAAPPAASSGELATRAFGLPAGGTLDQLPAATRPWDPLVADLHTVVWEPTLGYFLRQIMDPVVSDAQVDQVRDHFRRFVRPSGPLPLLRVGKQPYGVLPVVASARFGGDPTEMMLSRTLRTLRPIWAHAAGSARQLGDSGDPAADLVALLERTSRSVAFRVREATGPGMKANTFGFDVLHLFQQGLSQLLLAVALLKGRPAIVDITLDDEEAVLPVPLVTGNALRGDAGLSSDYVRRIADRMKGADALGRLAEDARSASSLLEALLVHAATLELVRGTTAVVLRHRRLQIPLGKALRDREILLVEDGRLRREVRPNARPMVPRDPRVEDPPEIPPPVPKDLEVDDDPAAETLTLTPLQLARARLDGVSGELSIADHLTNQTITQLRTKKESQQLADFRASIQRLVGAPTAGLHRTTADALDVLSHRYDAWATSLATRRLHTLRATAPTGLHIGAFGWVEGLRKRARPSSQGYVHGPSLSHATTAAILRSGHLARSGGAAEPLSIDLSSRRVRNALKLLEGLRTGQPVGALLGYRFERGLRDRGATYARYILPTRQRYPLAEGTAAQQGDQPVEAIAARGVVDGLRLAELDAAGRAALLDHLGAQTGHRAGITAELDALDDLLDAVGDLMVAESVFQAVVGNTERAAAALDALDRQSAIPEVAVAHTPRTGQGFSHRLLVTLDTDRAPASWNRLVDHRSRAEPRVNAWVARLLGDPATIQVAADVLDADGQVLDTVSVELRDLRMSALSVVLAAAHGSGEVSQLEERLAVALAAASTAPGAAGLRAHHGPPAAAPAGTVGFGELTTICRRIADLLSSVRPAIGRDLAPGTEPVDAVADVGEVQGRADALRAVVLDLAGADPTAGSLTAAAASALLRSAADLGWRGALPESDDLDRLRVQLDAVVAQATATLRQLDALEDGIGTSGTPGLLAEHHAERIRLVLGADFPVVPRIALPAALVAAINASTADPALLGRQPLAPTEWVLGHSAVRPAVERLWSVLTDAERRGTDIDATRFGVAQLPHRPGERWIALPADGATPWPQATTSLVVHRVHDGAPAQLGATTAALLVDQWHERVPSAEETTGIAFNFDSPGARPPQSILLAVPPTLDATHWTTDVLADTVRDAMELARMRTVDLDDLPGIGRFLPALYFAFNLENEVPSLDLQSLVEVSLKTWVMKEDG